MSLDLLASELREVEDQTDRARDDLKEAEGQAKQIDHQLENWDSDSTERPTSRPSRRRSSRSGGLFNPRAPAERWRRLTVDQARLAVADLNERSSGLLDGLLAVETESRSRSRFPATARSTPGVSS